MFTLTCQTKHRKLGRSAKLLAAQQFEIRCTIQLKTIKRYNRKRTQVIADLRKEIQVNTNQIAKAKGPRQQKHVALRSRYTIHITVWY